MDIGLKTGAAAVELTGELQVVHDFFVEHLTGDQQRNARRVRRDQTGGDAALEFVDRHALGGALRDVRKRVRWLHDRHQVAQVHLGGQARDVVLGVKRVHVLAQIAQTHFFVARMLAAELRQDAPHRLVAVVIVLELLQRGQQGVPAALGDADGEHDEEAVVTGFFHHHTVLGQKLGDDGRGDTGLGKVALEVQARRDDGRLDRVEHVEVWSHVAKAVPVFFGAHRRVGALRLVVEHPVAGLAHALFAQVVGAPDLEPPVVVTELVVDLAHGAAKVQRFQNALFHQGTAAGRLHHGRGHVAAGDDGVLWAGAGVHQVGLIEEVAVELDVL